MLQMDQEVVRWEKYLPQRVLSVLVVEPDDSTRNVISALLRNCNYTVTSVSDGIDAWEVLKQKPQSIDLVLTEVDLPSISGFTLLALLMDHAICTRIPVIMMSSQDSISTVVKCTLKGAADFLIKPVRKNELKNIWQHLWRKQIVCFDDGAILKRAKLHDYEGRKFQGEEETIRQPNSVAAIDLLDSIGAAGKGEFETSTSIVGKLNSACLPLELSLQGPTPSGSRENGADGGRLLNHSRASAFSRYNSCNGSVCSLPLYSTSHSKERGTVNECKVSHQGYIQVQSAGSNNGDKSTAVAHEKSEQVDRTNNSRMCEEIVENIEVTKPVDNYAGFNSAPVPVSRKDINRQVETFHLSAREAALIKFRQKRKERCFEKKVRYHSRKQQAEQRPRIKGQFVRQMRAD